MKNLNFIMASSAFMIIGCSSHTDIVRVSEVHVYNEEFGLLPDDGVDSQIQEELVSMSLPTQIDMPIEMNPEWTTELTKDTDAFYAHEYIEKEEVITYKYEFDTKFYDHAEWRMAEF